MANCQNVVHHIKLSKNSVKFEKMCSILSTSALFGTHVKKFLEIICEHISFTKFDVEKIFFNSPSNKNLDSLNANTSSTPTTFAFVLDDFEKEKERLKEPFKLKTKLLEMEQENEKLKNIFCYYVLSSDKIRNHYTGFSNVKILEAILNFLDPGKNGENILLYNSQLANEDETRRCKRTLSPMISFIITLAR